MTQAERTDAVLGLLEDMGGNVVLVGHSLGGVKISAAAEAAPERLKAVVYLTAFMLPPLMPALAMIQHEAMAGAAVSRLTCADPAVVGVMRINPASEDAAIGEQKGGFNQFFQQFVPVARQAHNLKAARSNRAPATIFHR